MDRKIGPERGDGLDISSFPLAYSDGISMLSLNVCAGGKGFEAFDEKINFTDDKRHTWSVRAPFLKKFLSSFGKTDIQAFQELSSQQVLDIQSYLGENYNLIVLTSHPSDIEAGIIRNTDQHSEEIKSWGEKNIGAFLVGIAYDKTKFSVLDMQRFWLNEDPWSVPTNKDSKAGDKGFGNTNTYRAVLGIKFKQSTSEKEFYVFNSHYPLSGGANARTGCAKTEMAEIQRLTQGLPFIATGDRNIIGTPSEANQVYLAFFDNQMDVRDCRDICHYGSGGSWIGFSTDRFKNPVENGVLQNKSTLCALFYAQGIKGVRSAHMLGEFDIQKNELTTLSSGLKEPELRTTISDHAAIIFHFNL